MNVFEFNLNETLLVELAEDECFSGELAFRSNAGTFIELQNVRNMRTNAAVDCPQIFYCSEITQITRLPSSIDPDEVVEEQPNANIAPDANKPDEPSSSTHLSADHFKRITAGIDDAQLIAGIGASYREAMHWLRKTRAFAVAVATEVRAGATVVSLISVCGEDQRVVQMDIKSLGRVPTELRFLLEARRPLKIVHNSPVAVYVLRSQHDVQLDGVFDTLVSSVYIDIYELLISID